VLLERRDRYAHLFDGLSGLQVCSRFHCMDPNYGGRSLTKMATDGLVNKVHGYATSHGVQFRMQSAWISQGWCTPIGCSAPTHAAARAGVSVLHCVGVVSVPVAALSSCRPTSRSDVIADQFAGLNLPFCQPRDARSRAQTRPRLSEYKAGQSSRISMATSTLRAMYLEWKIKCLAMSRRAAQR